jgi:beta-carotene ketolase (CrtW type)
MKYPLTEKDNVLGVATATLILFLWAMNLLLLLTTRVSAENWYLIPQFVLQILLYTGLFITAHDSMHGLVSHRNRKLNDSYGQLALSLFAFFSIKKMLPKHMDHHRYPASDKDPDYHDGQHPSVGAWFLRFFLGYASWMQIAGLAIIYNILHHVFGIAQLNLILFWLIPSLLSSFQLFYFGTYLPHREDDAGFKDEHRARSNDYPVWLSFLTCYHFGYHHEHHMYPWVQWWKLPRVRKEILGD